MVAVPAARLRSDRLEGFLHGARRCGLLRRIEHRERRSFLLSKLPGRGFHRGVPGGLPDCPLVCPAVRALRKIVMRKALTFAILAGSCFAADWPQYRGPNGSGVGDANRLPT